MRERLTTLESKENRFHKFQLARPIKGTGRPMQPEQHDLKSARFAARFRYAPDATPLNGYTIQRGIGIGGFGEVYFAKSDAGKEVALKRIQRNLDVELRGVQNCLNLKHLNLISLFDIRTDVAGDSWVVMEYVPGPSLRDIIEVHENGMPGHQIERWFAPIASGVNYLHDSGIIHRDLKPANIFLDEDENVIKIGDYGLSKFVSNSNGSGQTETVGTFHYMAPEIGKGVYGKGVDIYAMGIVLYEMLTGDVPFNGESSHEIIMKHMTADADLEKVPFDFREVIKRSLYKDPDMRFGSISELHEYLPWHDSVNGSRVLNAERFVMPTRYVAKETTSHNGNHNLPDLLEPSSTEGGILFGPLRDSSAGNRPVAKGSANDVLYIGDNRPAPTNPDPRVKKAEQLPHTSDKKPASKSRSEPIAAAVTTTWDSVADWFHDSTVSTPLKIFVLLFTGFAITANSQWLLPTSLALGFVYLLYFGVRYVVLSPVEGELQPKKLSRRRQRQLLQQSMRNRLAANEWSTRVTELTGGLLLSAIVCVALNLLGLAITESLFDSATSSWALFAWSTVLSVVGSWGLLVLGKFYESSEGDWFQRRVSMLVVGVIVGAVSFLTSSYFNVDFAIQSSLGFNPLEPSGLVISSSPFVANILFFAAMFLAVRWWGQVDPTRRTRLSILTVGLCLIWAGLLAHLLDFVPLLSCILIIVTSISVQLSSPWISMAEREKLKAKTIKNQVNG